MIVNKTKTWDGDGIVWEKFLKLDVYFGVFGSRSFCLKHCLIPFISVGLVVVSGKASSLTNTGISEKEESTILFSLI